MEILIIIFIIFVLVVFTRKTGAHVPSKGPKKKLDILSGSHCVMNETSIKTLTPVPLHGRVDQVFQLKDRRLLLVDTKAREKIRVYPSDIVQLSVYATILKNNGYELCPFAYIRLPRESNKVVYLPVKLYSEKRVIALYYKYLAIKDGQHHTKCTCGKHSK